MTTSEPMVIAYRARNLVNGHSYVGYTARGQGVALTEEHKNNIRVGQLLNPPSREKRSNPVRCLTDGRVFPSANAADRFYGLSPSSTAKIARGEFKSRRGLVFEYVVKS